MLCCVPVFAPMKMMASSKKVAFVLLHFVGAPYAPAAFYGEVSSGLKGVSDATVNNVAYALL